RNRPVDVGIEGDAGAVLEQIMAELGDVRVEYRDFVDGLREHENKVREMRQGWMNSDKTPIHPLRLCKEIAEFVDDDTLVVGDGGDIVGLASQVIPINHP